MSFLKPMTNQVAYFKVSGFGFSGTGKTYTTSVILAGLAKMIGEKRVACFETEGAASFVRKKVFEPAGIELIGHSSRSFKDLMGFCNEAQREGIKIIFVDSITHVWRDLMTSYKKAKGRSYISVKDWGVLKDQWSRFTDFVVQSPIHLVILGRAGFDYEKEENDQGKKEMMKSGTKMQAEKDFSFEPSLNLEFVKFRPGDKTAITEYGLQEYVAKGNFTAQEWIRACIVHKDRWTVLDGRVIPNPTFEDFLPHIKEFDFAQQHNPIDHKGDSAGMFGGVSDDDEKNERQIVLDEIKSEIIGIVGGGRTAAIQEMKANLLEDIFGVRSWKRIATFPLVQLQNALPMFQSIRANPDTCARYREKLEGQQVING